jgi:hypothetical protein
MWKNMKIDLNSKAMVGDTMIVNSIIMTTCISPFSNPLLDFDSMSEF